MTEFLGAYSDGTGKTIQSCGRLFAAQLKNSQSQGKSLGFESLGVSPWGDAHTSVCTNVRLDFKSGFDAQFNEYGFLTTLEQAELAAREYTTEEDGFGMENCDWFPVQIAELPLKGA